MIFPTIHINGTSPEMLVEGYREAYLAVLAAQEAIGKIEFNARDYYPHGPEAWAAARREHQERLQKLQRVADELMEIAMHIQDVVDERKARNG